MSGGITSYPRTGGGGGSSLAAMQRLLGQLNTGSIAGNDANAALLLAALAAFATTASDAQVIDQAKIVRDALFIAREKHRLSRGWHGEAMEICAQAFKSLYPIEQTAVAVRSQAATQALVPGLARSQVRALKEQIGLCAWIYEASALLGQDIAATLAANASSLSGDWSCAIDSANQLTYLETAGAYNVNVVIRIDIPGSSGPMIIAGEAKGGHSAYGEVHGPSGVIATVLLTPPISQRSLVYAVSRAHYMANTKLTDARSLRRKEAGNLILDAAKDDRLVFMAARGDSQGGLTQDTKRDYLECK